MNKKQLDLILGFFSSTFNWFSSNKLCQKVNINWWSKLELEKQR